MKILIAVLAACLALTGCATAPTTGPDDVTRLAQTIENLSPDVDPAEARRAAEISYSYSSQLKQDWNVTDAAIVHNAKIINGMRDKGLCNDWAQAMSTRLRQEDFKTLDMHWVTSPPTAFRIIHHSALISAKGDSMDEGIILDPWRNSGVLYWAPVGDDTKYNWRPRLEVREELITGVNPY